MIAVNLAPKCADCGLGICERCAPVYRFRYISNIHYRMWQRKEYRELAAQARR